MSRETVTCSVLEAGHSGSRPYTLLWWLGLFFGQSHSVAKFAVMTVRYLYNINQPVRASSSHID